MCRMRPPSRFMPLAYIKLIDRLNTSTPDIGDPLPKEVGEFKRGDLELAQELARKKNWPSSQHDGLVRRVYGKTWF